jgi:hypothetical protein
VKLDPIRKFSIALYLEFIEKLLWGGKVVGLRVSLKAANASVVKSLVLDAYNARVSKDAGAKTKKMNAKNE